MDKRSVQPDGVKITRIRQAKGWSQEVLAAKAGYHKRTIERLEQGAPTHPSTLQEVAVALGVAMTELLVAAGAEPMAVSRVGRRAHRIRRPLTRLIGRAQDLAMVRRLLPTTRLLTLTGPCGCGKTRLALEIVSDLEESYPDAVWIVELGALTDPTLLPATLASRLGLLEEPGPPVFDTLVEALACHEILLVLDNCEHLCDACALLVETLLGACPALQILATSRVALGVAGEQLWRVEPLAVPAAEALPSLEKLQQYSAVQLFLERAQAVQPAFMLTPENAVAIAQVCRQLDGLPLALELAAGRLKLLDITQLAGRLDDRFRLLAGGRRLAPPRQQTLKATVDWSYDHLMEAERIVWRRLAVFAGSWSLAAAEVVCRGGEVAAEEVLERLAALVDHSLVQVEEVGGERRYRLLETLRQYGEERLQQAGEARAIRCRHRDWYLALAEQAEPQLRGAEQPLWLARLEQEHDNLRVALAWSLAEASELEAGLRMAGALWRFWTARSYLREGRYWLEALLAKGEGAATAIRAKAHVGAGHLAMAQGDEAAVHAHLQASLMLYRAMRDPQGCATASSILGQVALAPGEYAAARAHLEGSLVLAQTVGDT